jgi:hypothetical protein
MPVEIITCDDLPKHCPILYCALTGVTEQATAEDLAAYQNSGIDVPADNQEDIDFVVEAAAKLELDNDFQPDATATITHINSEDIRLVGLCIVGVWRLRMTTDDIPHNIAQEQSYRLLAMSNNLGHHTPRLNTAEEADFIKAMKGWDFDGWKLAVLCHIRKMLNAAA